MVLADTDRDNEANVFIFMRNEMPVMLPKLLLSESVDRILIEMTFGLSYLSNFVGARETIFRTKDGFNFEDSTCFHGA